MFYFLIYVSSATRLFSRQDLNQILDVSRKNNSAMDVSGILLYKDGNLMQVLEGERQVVRDLYDKIGRDQRHRGLIEIWDGESDDRQFPDWSMAFRDLNGEDARSTPGYSEFLNTPLTSEQLATDPTYCQQLLDLFKITM